MFIRCSSIFCCPSSPSSSSLRRNVFPNCRTVVIASISTSWSPSIPWRPPVRAQFLSTGLCPTVRAALNYGRSWMAAMRGFLKACCIPKALLFLFFWSDFALCWYNCSLEECARCLQRGPFFFRKRGGPVLCDVGVSLCSSVAIHRDCGIQLLALHPTDIGIVSLFEL